MRASARPPKLSRFLKRRDTTKKPPPAHPKRLDQYLQRVAWFSQIVLVVAGVFGYWFTVRPVHQKQLLDEQIAERTIELKAASANLQSLKADAERLQNENAALGAEASSFKAEAAKTYEQFRDTLALEILAVPSRCAVNASGSVNKPERVPDCVSKFLSTEVSRAMKERDQKLLSTVFESHKESMVTTAIQVNKRFAEKARRLPREMRALVAELEASVPAVRAEIHALRVARANGKDVVPDPPTGNIIVRVQEDRDAYARFSKRRELLNDRLHKLETEKIFLDADLDSAHYEALSNIATKMFNDFRKGIRQGARSE